MRSYQHESQKEEAEKGHARRMCSWHFFPFLSPFIFLDLMVSLPLCSLLFCPQAWQFVMAEDKFFRDLSFSYPCVCSNTPFLRINLENSWLPCDRSSQKKGRRFFGSSNFMSSAPCTQLMLFLTSYCIAPWDSITPSSHQVCLPLPSFLTAWCPKASKKYQNQKGTAEKQWFYMWYSVKLCRLQNLGDKMLHNLSNCIARVELLCFRLPTYSKSLHWFKTAQRIEETLCLQYISVLLLFPICMVGKVSIVFITVKNLLLPSSVESTEQHPTYLFVSLSKPVGWLLCFYWFLGTFPPQSALPKPSDISVMWTRQWASRSELTQFVAPT